MPTSRAFAYNPSLSAPTGAIQFGNLAVQSTGWTSGCGGLTWFNGPDEDLGYVIGYTYPGPKTVGSYSQIISATSVGFRRSTQFTDSSFLSSVNNLTGQSFLTASNAISYLNSNGYWTSLSYVTSNLALHLDAGNSLSYPGSGTTWTDLAGNKTFTLYNSPSYSSSNGGYLNFTPSSGQYARSNAALGSLTNWTVEVWHYYSGTNTGTSPCIVTEYWPNSTGNINFSLGNNSDSSPLLQSGFFNGGWRNTSTTSLTASNWYHIVGTYDGSNLKLYINNSLSKTASYVGTAASSNNSIILMRRWDNPPGGFWGGRLGVVRIYSSALNQTQINQNWTAQKSRFGL